MIIGPSSTQSYAQQQWKGLLVWTSFTQRSDGAWLINDKTCHPLTSKKMKEKKGKTEVLKELSSIYSVNNIFFTISRSNQKSGAVWDKLRLNSRVKCWGNKNLSWIVYVEILSKTSTYRNFNNFQCSNRGSCPLAAVQILYFSFGHWVWLT